MSGSRHQTIVFLSSPHDGGEKLALTSLTVDVADSVPMERNEIMNRLRRAVSRWARTCDEGLDLYQNTGRFLSAIDLGAYECWNDQALHIRMEFEGLNFVSVVYANGYAAEEGESLILEPEDMAA